LFGKELFTPLLALQGDTGGRQVLDQTSVEMLEWENSRIGEDIDTLEDYQRLIGQ
jgi:CTP:molybdopterin cytidylyltransferase MocA